MNELNERGGRRAGPGGGEQEGRALGAVPSEVTGVGGGGSPRGRDQGLEEGQGIKGQRRHLGQTGGQTGTTWKTWAPRQTDRQTTLTFFLGTGSRRLAWVPT